MSGIEDFRNKYKLGKENARMVTTNFQMDFWTNKAIKQDKCE